MEKILFHAVQIDPMALFPHMKCISASSSTPNSPLQLPKPHLNRIVSLSPTVHYKLEQHIVSVFKHRLILKLPHRKCTSLNKSKSYTNYPVE